MRLVFAEQAWEDYLHWQETDTKLLRRVNALIKEAMRTPFSGTGKPEALKHALAGYWSRRINDEHRMVYKVDGDALLIVQVRYHYASFNLWLKRSLFEHSIVDAVPS